MFVALTLHFQTLCTGYCSTVLALVFLFYFFARCWLHERFFLFFFSFFLIILGKSRKECMWCLTMQWLCYCQGHSVSLITVLRFLQHSRVRGGLSVLGLKLRGMSFTGIWLSCPFNPGLQYFGGTLGVSFGVLLGFFLLLGFGLYPEDLIQAGMSNFCSICWKFLQYKLNCVHLLVIKTSVWME